MNKPRPALGTDRGQKSLVSARAPPEGGHGDADGHAKGTGSKDISFAMLQAVAAPRALIHSSRASSAASLVKRLAVFERAALITL
jgi:hypothetical protein